MLPGHFILSFALVLQALESTALFMSPWFETRADGGGVRKTGQDIIQVFGGLLFAI